VIDDVLFGDNQTSQFDLILALVYMSGLSKRMKICGRVYI
jgi:hypothetical protein